MVGFISGVSVVRVSKTAAVSSKAVNVRRARAERVQMSMVPVTEMTPVLTAADMAVTFPAYLAVFLGTLIPISFLILLYVQTEARNAGERDATE